MRPAKLFLDGRAILPKAEEARLPRERMRGLLGIEALDADYALVFRHCPQVHCKGMKIPIDVVSLDKRGRILDASTVAPGLMGPRVRGCSSVIEMRAGRAAELGMRPGRQVLM